MAYVASTDVLLGADVVIDNFEEEACFGGDEVDEGLEVGFGEFCAVLVRAILEVGKGTYRDGCGTGLLPPLCSLSCHLGHGGERSASSGRGSRSERGDSQRA